MTARKITRDGEELRARGRAWCTDLWLVLLLQFGHVHNCCSAYSRYSRHSDKPPPAATICTVATWIQARGWRGRRHMYKQLRWLKHVRAYIYIYLPLVANNNLIAQLFFRLFLYYFVFFLGICCVAWHLYFSYQALYNLHSIYSPMGLRFIGLWYDRLLCSLTFIDLTFHILYNWINLYLNGRRGKILIKEIPCCGALCFFAYHFFVLYHDSQLKLADQSCCDFCVTFYLHRKLVVVRDKYPV